jgi:hypothetical protein
MDPGKQFSHIRTALVVIGVVKDQKFFSSFPCQHIEHTSNDGHQIQHELVPVVPGILEEVIRRILLESQIGISYNPLRKINAFKGQRKNHSEQGEWRNTSQLSDPVAMQQSTDLKILDEGRYCVLQLFCFLLIPVLLRIVNASLFFFDIIEFSADPNMPEKKGFRVNIELF